MVALVRLFSRFSWDAVGFSASALCAIHCLAVPLLLMISTFSGLEILHSHTLETGILVFSSVVGSVSIVPGWRKHHRRVTPMLLFVPGVLLIAIGRLHMPVLLETMVTTCGAILVASAHWLNWKLCRPFHLIAGSKKNLV